MKTEYMNRMEVLAEEINSGKLNQNMCVGIGLNPPLVEWFPYQVMQEDNDRYDGIFFVESLYVQTDKTAQWDGESLAEYLETLTREFVSENQGEE